MPDSVTELFTQGSRCDFSQHPEITLRGQGGQRSGELGHGASSLLAGPDSLVSTELHDTLVK